MTAETFFHSLQHPAPPPMPPCLEALWWEAQGDWEHAHTMAQELSTREAAWVHAFLHRREGDAGNAAYWYRRAGRSVCRLSFEEERLEMVRVFCEAQEAG